MLHIGSIFFPLKIDPKRIENNFKGHYIETAAKIKLCQYVKFLQSRNFDNPDLQYITTV